MVETESLEKEEEFVITHLEQISLCFFSVKRANEVAIEGGRSQNPSRNCPLAYAGTMGHRGQGDRREVKWRHSAEELLMMIRMID